ncbi:hypothetical protein RRG08_002306 [Elysia crispata]|uniref:Uncharacterized protein n=1 Tax=Elysia crispata TaxID=231223 RepID=A0AAE0ZB91_9GAST|nr:hypothetical protein RRG08_002306 [Elysia crispata]
MFSTATGYYAKPAYNNQPSGHPIITPASLEINAEVLSESGGLSLRTDNSIHLSRVCQPSLQSPSPPATTRRPD